MSQKKNKKNYSRRTGMLLDAIKYLKESQKYIYLVVVLFIISGIIGFSFPQFFSYFDKVFADLVESLKDFGPIQLILFILLNNAIASFFGMVLGVFVGIPTLFVILNNGAAIGYILSKVWVESGAGSFLFLLPHGIFELPAVFISLGLGLKLGMFVFAKNRKKEIVRRAINSLKVFLVIVIPLLIIAAFIEGLLIFSYK